MSKPPPLPKIGCPDPERQPHPKLVEPSPERQRRARVETTLNTLTSPEAPSSGMLARSRGINSIGRVPPLQGGS